MKQSNDDDLVEKLAAPFFALIVGIYTVVVLSIVGLFGMLLEEVGLPRQSPLNGILSWVLPIALLLIIYWLFFS